MIIGTPKEIKNHEYRVGLTPESAGELATSGHEVLVEDGAGLGIGSNNDDYVARGAHIVESAGELFERADMVVKVKEPQAQERAMLRKDQLLFTYLHLAADEPQTKDLLASGVIAIAYETVTDRSGGLPLLLSLIHI